MLNTMSHQSPEIMLFHNWRANRHLVSNRHQRKYRIDLIVLAGFMSILSEDFTRDYPERIINVHPSLIPSFCGVGYYGLRVHEEALAYGVKVTGVTVSSNAGEAYKVGRECCSFGASEMGISASELALGIMGISASLWGLWVVPLRSGYYGQKLNSLIKGRAF